MTKEAPITFQEVIDRDKIYEPKGVEDPTKVLWELKDGLEGFVTGIYYPVTPKPTKKTTKSMFKDMLGVEPPKDANTSSVGSIGVTFNAKDTIQISREEYEGLIIYRDRALILGKYSEVSNKLKSSLNELIELQEKVNYGKESIDETIDFINGAISAIESY